MIKRNAYIIAITKDHSLNPVKTKITNGKEQTEYRIEHNQKKTMMKKKQIEIDIIRRVREREKQGEGRKEIER